MSDTAQADPEQRALADHYDIVVPSRARLLVKRLRRLRWAAVRRRYIRHVRFGTRLLGRIVHPGRYVALPSNVLWSPEHTGCSINPGQYADPPIGEPEGFHLRPLALEQPARILFPDYRYSRPAPRLFGDPAFLERVLRNYSRDTAKPHGAAVAEAVLEHAIILRDAVYVAKPDGVYAVYESLRATDRTAAIYPGRTELRTVKPIGHADPRCMPDYVFLGCIGSFNYGHFITDDLTRLSLPNSAGTTVILMTDHGPLMNSRRTELLHLALRGHRFGIRFIDADQPVAVQHLRYAGRASRHPIVKSPEAIATMTARVIDGLPPVDGPGDNKVLIARTGTATRGLVNLPEIVKLLTARGFRTLDPIAASVSEQVATCARASCIVGVMGAAMVNSVFAPAGTQVVHLAPEGWMEPYYWDLAAVRDHRYVAAYGPSFGHHYPWLRSFRIDSEVVLDALKW